MLAFPSPPLSLFSFTCNLISTYLQSPIFASIASHPFSPQTVGPSLPSLPLPLSHLLLCIRRTHPAPTSPSLPSPFPPHCIPITIPPTHPPAVLFMLATSRLPLRSPSLLLPPFFCCINRVSSLDSLVNIVLAGSNHQRRIPRPPAAEAARYLSVSLLSRRSSSSHRPPSGARAAGSSALHGRMGRLSFRVRTTSAD